MDNFHSVLIIADEAPVDGDLCPNLFGLNVINDVADMPLEGFRFEMCFTERAKDIYTKHNLFSILAEHEGERVELAVERANRIDGAVTRLWFKKGTNVEIFMGFEFDLCTFSIYLWVEQGGIGTVCYDAFRLGFGEDGCEGTVRFQKSAADITREADLAGDDLLELGVCCTGCLSHVNYRYKVSGA